MTRPWLSPTQNTECTGQTNIRCGICLWKEVQSLCLYSVKVSMLDVLYLSEHSERSHTPRESFFYLLITLLGDKSDPTTLGCVWNVHDTHTGHKVLRRTLLGLLGRHGYLQWWGKSFVDFLRRRGKRQEASPSCICVCVCVCAEV